MNRKFILVLLIAATCLVSFPAQSNDSNSTTEGAGMDCFMASLGGGAATAGTLLACYTCYQSATIAIPACQACIGGLAASYFMLKNAGQICGAGFAYEEADAAAGGGYLDDGAGEFNDCIRITQKIVKTKVCIKGTEYCWSETMIFYVPDPAGFCY